jgi:hypothetical protein
MKKKNKTKKAANVQVEQNVESKAGLNSYKQVDSMASQVSESAASEEPKATVEEVDCKTASPSVWQKVKGNIGSFWRGLIYRQFFQKIFSLFFALIVFGAVYFYMVAHRSILTYMGVMLLMVIVYAEILVVRDHLWVIEGSMREARRWRDIFFNQTSLRRQRFRKILVMLFALGIFSYVYNKSSQNAPILSFLGIMLMITVLYYEILTIRDEVFVMMRSITGKEDEEKKDLLDKGHKKFLEKASDANTPEAPTATVKNEE